MNAPRSSSVKCATRAAREGVEAKEELSLEAFDWLSSIWTVRARAGLLGQSRAR